MLQPVDYLIKLSGTLMVLYLFYWLVLRRLTFYAANRWYLLGYSIAAFFIPFIDINPLLEKARLENDQFVTWIPVINGEGLDRNGPVQLSDQVWHVKDIVFILFMIGIIVMLARFIVQYFSLRSVRRAARLISDGHVKVYHSDKNIIPFSFGNSIFINKNKHSEDDLQDIIRHEFIHVKQNHTVDILLSEWICIFNWYNPFAWLIRKAIRQNLEFIADHKVLQNGIDKKQYQYLLLKVVGVHQYGIATSFNFTSLKKRIAMMNKMRSARLHFIKFLFVFPLLAVILLAFRNKLSSQGFDQRPTEGALILTDPPTNKIFFADTIPSPKKLSVSPRPSQNVKPNAKGYVITIADNNGECVVIVKDKQHKIVKAVTLVEWDENQQKYKSEYGEIPPAPPAPASAAGPTKVPTAPQPAVAPTQISMPENVYSIHVKDKELTLTLKNGETELYDLDKPEQKAAFEKKYGVLRQTSPAPVSGQNPGSHPSPIIIFDTDEKEKKPTLSNEKKDNVTVTFQTRRDNILNVDTTGKVLGKTFGDFDGLILLDAKEYDKKSFEKEVKLDPSDIQSIDVLKGESAVREYGEKGKNGVIRITTKQK